MAATITLHPASTGERIDGALFSVEVSAAQSDGAGWSVWLASDGRSRRLFESPEQPFCALCERPTAHGGVAAVAFSRLDGRVELHELDATGNSIHIEQR